ncbi:RNA polymerase sigma factor [Alicyclobacillus dauci]|uniref:RNA polymerase sigma factor n=1 Tax=Alicyclobacillus dauci TaxID=1475485 RepID=A0ABY6Z0J1_9BACL|nr:RNA polymerase sigma factor [Alicyclobacillus dauci]WAH36103.1 RNA polymerase sigma factor [Alicyclobacillus dauci]
MNIHFRPADQLTLYQQTGHLTFNDSNEVISRVRGLVERHQNWLIHLASSYLGNIQSAEDCVQDVFLTALTKLDWRLSDTAVRNWLATCTVNRAKSILRSANVRRLTLMNGDDLANFGPTTDDTYASLDESGVLGHVMALPIKYREVIVLRYYHDLSMTDIAHILRISENTVKTRLRRGKKRLRQTLTHAGGDL